MAQKGELNNTHGTNNTYEEEEVKLLGVMTSMNKSMKKMNEVLRRLNKHTNDLSQQLSISERQNALAAIYNVQNTKCVLTNSHVSSMEASE